MKRIIILATIIICMTNSCTKSKQTTTNNNSSVKNSDNINNVNNNLSDTIKLIDDYLTQLNKEKNFSGGIMIVKNGKKFFSKGYGWANKEQNTPFTSSTLASMGSITKAFTAAAIMKLCEEGKLSVNDPTGILRQTEDWKLHWMICFYG